MSPRWDPSSTNFCWPKAAQKWIDWKCVGQMGVFSSNEVCVVVLNKHTIFGRHIVQWTVNRNFCETWILRSLTILFPYLPSWFVEVSVREITGNVISLPVTDCSLGNLGRQSSGAWCANDLIDNITNKLLLCQQFFRHNRQRERAPLLDSFFLLSLTVVDHLAVEQDSNSMLRTWT